ncbi:MAG: type II toxin-antitoxin system MqsA family antitoxin [Acetobacteraceae bacterium]
MAKNTATTSEFLEAVQEMADILTGKIEPARVWPVPAEVDVRAIRRKLKLTQSEFAARFAFSLSAVREWEQGRRRPEQAARTLLLVIARDPDVVVQALAAA